MIRSSPQETPPLPARAKPYPAVENLYVLKIKWIILNLMIKFMDYLSF